MWWIKPRGTEARCARPPAALVTTSVDELQTTMHGAQQVSHHVSDSVRKPHRLVKRATVALRTEAAVPSAAILEATPRGLSYVRTRDQRCTVRACGVREPCSRFGWATPCCASRMAARSASHAGAGALGSWSTLPQRRRERESLRSGSRLLPRVACFGKVRAYYGSVARCYLVSWTTPPNGS